MNSSRQLERMGLQDLTPDPRPILHTMAEDVSQSSVRYGFAHGSMLYKSEGSLTAAYQETKVSDPHTNEIISLDYAPKFQPPDIDIVVVVDDRRLFIDYFNKVIQSDYFKDGLNYFFTLNVVEPNVMESEVTDVAPRALKRILAYRKIFPFGNNEELESKQALAATYSDKSDEEFQRQFDERKKMLEQKLLNGALPFTLSADEFKRPYPDLFDNLSIKHGGFPEERDKLVLPHEMGLKCSRNVGELVSKTTFER